MKCHYDTRVLTNISTFEPMQGIHDLFDQFTRRVEGHVQQNNWEQRLTIPSNIGRGTVTRTRIRPGMEIMVTDITVRRAIRIHKQAMLLSWRMFEFIALFGESDGYGSIGGSMLLRRDDITKLQQTRELVQNHFEQLLSIRELAKRVGMNEFKLKKGFRELFGMTIACFYSSHFD